MAEVFDISKHIKVEALGVRNAEIASATEILVDGKIYNSDDYSLVPSSIADSTEIFPIDDMSYEWIVLRKSGSLEFYFKEITGATDYRYYVSTSSTLGNPISFTGTFPKLNINRISQTYGFNWFKVQALVGGTWTDVIAEPDGSPVIWDYSETATGSFPGAWEQPNLLSTENYWWCSGGIVMGYSGEPYPDGEGLHNYDSTRYKLSFTYRPPSAVGGWISEAIDVSDYNEIDKFLIGISGTGDSYPQYYVSPRATFPHTITSGEGVTTELLAQAPYEFLLDKSIFDQNSTKISVTLLKTNGTVEVLLDEYLGPEPLTGLTINPTILSPLSEGTATEDPYDYSLNVTSIQYDGQTIPESSWSQYMTTTLNPQGEVSLFFPQDMWPTIVFNYLIGSGSYRTLNNANGTTFVWPIVQDAHNVYADIGTHQFRVQTYPTTAGPELIIDATLDVSVKDGYVYPGTYGNTYTIETVDVNTKIYRWLGTGDFYVGLTPSEKYPLYKVTGPSGTSWHGDTYTAVQVTNLPTDYVLNVITFDGTVQLNELVGDPYQFEYVDVYYAYGWWPIECAVTSCEIDTGYNIEKGLLKTGDPGTASISLKGNEGNPGFNAALKLDAKIKILLAAEASPDGSEDYLFSGFIESWSTTYDPFGNAITNINCVDTLSRILNVNIPLYDIASAESFSDRMYNVLNNYVAPSTSYVSFDTTLWPLLQAFDGSVFPPEYRENVSVSEIINELTQGEYGVICQNRGGVIYWFNRAAPALFYDPTLVNEPNYYGFSTEHSATSLDHHCITDFTIRNSLDDITNKVIASLTYDELTTANYEDTASISQYGERSYEVALNVYAPSGNQTQYLDSWLAEVPYSEDQSEIESVTTNVVNRLGLVTKAYQYDITFDPIRVFISTGPLNFNGTLFAKRIRHSIDPENWTMTLELTAD